MTKIFYNFLKCTYYQFIILIKINVLCNIYNVLQYNTLM